MEYDDESEESMAERSRKRARQPRLGSFVTIAVAILLLFGAVSRMGKWEETAALVGIDLRTREAVSQEQKRLETIMTLGPRLAPMQDVPHRNELPINSVVIPPSRGAVDINDWRDRQSGNLPPTPVSMAYPDERDQDNGNNGRLRPPGTQANAGTAPSAPQTPPAGSRSTYVVKAGDTWNKIAIRTLGSANRWQELRNANPSASNGLTVGMELIVPN